MERTSQRRKVVRFSERENRVLFFGDQQSSQQQPPLSQQQQQQQPTAKTSRVDPRQRVRDDAAKILSKRYGDLLCGSFDDPIENCQNNINAFVLDVPDAEHARGLERYLSLQHKEERDGAREDVYEAVLARQRQLNKRNRMATTAPTASRSVARPNSIHNDGRQQSQGKNIISDEERMEKIRNASRQYSRPSRIFARRLGIADELAAQQVDEKEDEHDEDDDSEEGESIRGYPMNPYLCLPRHTVNCTPLHGKDTTAAAESVLANAKMVSRQPSIRELNLGICSKAAVMNAKKASRQLSFRQLNVSIRNLAAATSLNNSSSHSMQDGSTHSNNSSTSSLMSSSLSSLGASSETITDSLLSPSLLPKHQCAHPFNFGITSKNRKRDRALKLPARPGLSSSSLHEHIKPESARSIIQDALDLMEPEPQGDDFRRRSIACLSA